MLSKWALAFSLIFKESFPQEHSTCIWDLTSHDAPIKIMHCQNSLVCFICFQETDVKPQWRTRRWRTQNETLWRERCSPAAPFQKIPKPIYCTSGLQKIPSHLNLKSPWLHCGLHKWWIVNMNSRQICPSTEPSTNVYSENRLRDQCWPH